MVIGQQNRNTAVSILVLKIDISHDTKCIIRDSICRDSHICCMHYLHMFTKLQESLILKFPVMPLTMATAKRIDPNNNNVFTYT